MSAPHLRFENVEIAANGETLLGPLTLSVTSPGITVIMGPNGAGKSLLLSAAHGLIDPSVGSITWDGVAARTNRAARGFVFQTTPILRRSVTGNVVFPLIAQKIPGPKRRRLLQNALEAARLTDAAHKPAAALSGGERKRLALARAMVCEPKVLLLDEPAANLDPASTFELEQSLRNISSGSTKIYLSTHDIAQARRLADDILFIDHGQLVEQSPAPEFLNTPATKAAANYLKGIL